MPVYRDMVTILRSLDEYDLEEIECQLPQEKRRRRQLNKELLDSIETLELTLAQKRAELAKLEAAVVMLT